MKKNEQHDNGSNEKAMSMQEQMSNKSGEMEILRKKRNTRD